MITQAAHGGYFTFPSTEQITAFTRCFGALYEQDEVLDLLTHRSTYKE
jgi:methionyl-tRNA formyltransferase